MPKLKYDTRRKITWKDIQELVRNIKEYYYHYTIKDEAPLLLLESIFLIYREHMEKQPNKNINLNVERNRPKIMRSAVIMRYKGKEPDKGLIEDYRTDKGRINRKLEELTSKKDKMMNEILNPKGLVLVAAERKGRGEISNYFVPMELSIKPSYRAKDRDARALMTPLQILQNGSENWKIG